MSQEAVRVFIIYAPSPDEPIFPDHPEDCAAYQYAVRAKESLLLSSSVDKNHNDSSSWNVTISCMEESSFENVLSSRDSTDVNETSSPKVLLLLILSCSADGSIHRSVRKATKRLGQQDRTSNKTNVIHLGTALLGHARCDNSAKQMKQTIFGPGRRIEKTLLTTSDASFVSIQERLETQVELVGPEEEFDPWWSSVIQQCQTP